MEIKPGMKFEYSGITYEVLAVKVQFTETSGLSVSAKLKFENGVSGWFNMAAIGQEYQAGNVKVVGA